MSLQEYPELEQGTPEWLEARRGIITASVVGQLVTKVRPSPDEFACPDCESQPGDPCADLRNGKAMKGVHSGRTKLAANKPMRLVPADMESSRGLILTLAAERITGYVEETYVSRDMERGKDEEPFARAAYADNYGDVIELGFMKRDDWGFEIGYSPDGLVGTEGLIEIKSRRAKRHVEIVLTDEVPDENMAQLQTGLLVSGRKWIDYVDFSNGMHLYTKRVEPDPEWFDVIEEAVCLSEERIREYVTAYTEAAANLPATERIIELEDMRIA